MKRALVLGVVFLFALLASVLARVPLAFVLEQAGLREAGVSWTRAEGTIWRGQIDNVAVGAQPIGDVFLKLRPAALLKGTLTYEAHTQGHLGRASGKIMLGQGTIAAAGLEAEINAAQLVYAASGIRRAGGQINVRQANITLRNKSCQNASGTVTSDIVSNLAAVMINQTASDLAGALSCAGPDLQLAMQGSVGQGEPLQIVVNVALTDMPGFNVNVHKVAPIFAVGLTQYGFEPEGDGYTFRRDMSELKSVR